MRRAVKCLALLMLAGLISAACGARVPESVRQAAINHQLGGSNGSSSTTGPEAGSSQGFSTTGPGTSGTTGANQSGTGGNQQGGGGGGGTVPGAGSSTGPNGGQGGGGPTTGTSTGPGTTKGGGGPGPSSKPGTSSSSGSTTAPASSNSNCPTSASGPGIDGKTINIGTIADETGPVNGLFDGAVEGMQAFVNYVNSSGGICGFTLHDDSADDGTNCTSNQADTSSLGAKTFALVGTFSLYDNCGDAYIEAHNVPDIHVALSPAAGTPKTHFDMEPGTGYATGMFKAYDKELGSKVQSVGTIVEGIPSAEAKQANIDKAAESQGWKFVYNQTTSPTTSDWTSNFTTMCRQDHIQVFFEVTEDAAYAAKMVSDEQAAGCTGVTNIIPVAYDQAFLPDLNSDGGSSLAASVQGYSEYSLFFNSSDASNIPGVATLQTWFRRTYPDSSQDPLNLYAMFAWSDGLMLQQAIENNDSKTLTQASLVAALDKIKNFNAQGLMAPVTPSDKTTGASCYILYKEDNGGFVRTDGTPANNYLCGSYLQG